MQDKGIGHVYIKPRTPRLNGKVERSHRIDAEEFYRLLDGVVIDDAKVFNDKLQEWEDYYNYHRPHGALDGQTPYERLRQKTHPGVADLPQPHTTKPMQISVGPAERGLDNVMEIIKEQVGRDLKTTPQRRSGSRQIDTDPIGDDVKTTWAPS